MTPCKHVLRVMQRSNYSNLEELEDNTMKTLPDNVKPYQQTAVFDQDSIPAGLLRDHQLKVGTWGKIHVIEGKLILEFIGDDGEIVVLTNGKPGIIPPQQLHQVSAAEAVKFFVEFHH